MEKLTANERFAALELPEENNPTSSGIYRSCLVNGTHLYVSGHGPIMPDGKYMTGKIGGERSIEDGQLAARLTGIAILRSIKHELGSLDRVKRVVKILGMVNCTSDFAKHPFVINGCSELFRDIFGEENGVGVRSAVGMGSLPDQITVEIEALFELS